MPKPRTYSVGVTAIVTVHDDGTVTYDFDTSDAHEAVEEEVDGEILDDNDEPIEDDAAVEAILNADANRILKANEYPLVLSPGATTMRAVVAMTVPVGTDADAVEDRFERELSEFPDLTPVVYASVEHLKRDDADFGIDTHDLSRIAVRIDLPVGTDLNDIAMQIDGYFPDADCTVYPSMLAVVRDQYDGVSP